MKCMNLKLLSSATLYVTMYLLLSCDVPHRKLFIVAGGPAYSVLCSQLMFTTLRTVELHVIMEFFFLCEQKFSFFFKNQLILIHDSNYTLI